MLSIRYRATASSAQKSTSTFTEGGNHVNRFRNSTSGPTSLSREKTISNCPLEFGTQRAVSTDTTAVHFRSNVAGCISDKWTSLNAKVGPHSCRPTAGVMLTTPITPPRNPAKHDRYIVGSPSCLILNSPHLRAAGSFTLNIAAHVRAAYMQNPLAIEAQSPIAPRSSQ